MRIYLDCWPCFLRQALSASRRAGNIIDYGVSEDYDLGATLERVLHATPPIDDMQVLRRALGRAEEVLYLADNAGETVFDRVLIEALPVPVRYAVKAGPVLNDATREEAIAAGVHEVAEIIDTGCDAMGALLGLCSPGFRECFDRARLIIAKGQANHETLSGVDAPICFMLQAKCSVIAEDIGVAPGSVIIQASEALRGG
jgi:uncharacterized protein with ATP-grasp and redox domains